MKLGLGLGILTPQMGDPATLAIEAEFLGYDSYWFGDRQNKLRFPQRRY